MASSDVRVNVAVSDRILLHLWEQDHQADHYIVSFEMTRPGIAEICALHLPNVSRTMRDLISEGLVSEHTRSIRGEDRRQKTWQLTDEGRKNTRNRIEKLRAIKILIRDSKGKLLELRADEASKKLRTELTLLQVLMHAQHEGVLNFGDIRFGAIVRSEEKNQPGSLFCFQAHIQLTILILQILEKFTAVFLREKSLIDGITQIFRCLFFQALRVAEKLHWYHFG